MLPDLVWMVPEQEVAQVLVLPGVEGVAQEWAMLVGMKMSELQRQLAEEPLQFLKHANQVFQDVHVPVHGILGALILLLA